MPKSKNEETVLALSNIGNKREGSKSNYTAPNERPRVNKSQNAKVVERNDSDKTVDAKTMQHYREQMVELVGDSQCPAVLYKGAHIPRRVLSDYSYLTR